MKNRSTILIAHTVRHLLTTVTLFGVESNGSLIIKGLSFGKQRSIAGIMSENSCNPELLIHAESIKNFLDGTLHDLSKIPIDLSWCTPFTKRVLIAAGKIAWGQTISYAELARRAGNAGAFRAAASVMRHNRFPLIIPCHRVVRSDGTIGGFMGKQTGKAIELKKLLVEREKNMNRMMITGKLF
jgi:O-6-methylguanine DNA methyltransferase